MARAFEGGADCADPAIHHVRGANDVCASVSLAHGLFDKSLDGFVIEDFPISHKPIMAIDVIGIERHIGHHRDFRHCGFDRAGRPVRQVVGVPRFGAIGGFEGRIGIGKEADRRNAKIGGFAGGLDNFVDRAAHDAGHRGHGFLDPFAIAHKHRPDQVIDA